MLTILLCKKRFQKMRKNAIFEQKIYKKNEGIKIPQIYLFFTFSMNIRDKFMIILFR